MTDSLAAAAIAPYFTVREDFIRGTVVSYRATSESPVFTVAAHEWLPEFVVEIEDKIVARRKTPAAALRALVREADKAAR